MAEKHDNYAERQRRQGRKTLNTWVDGRALDYLDALKQRHGLADRGAVIEFLYEREQEQERIAQERT